LDSFRERLSLEEVRLDRALNILYGVVEKLNAHPSENKPVM